MKVCTSHVSLQLIKQTINIVVFVLITTEQCYFWRCICTLFVFANTGIIIIIDIFLFSDFSETLTLKLSGLLTYTPLGVCIIATGCGLTAINSAFLINSLALRAK